MTDVPLPRIGVLYMEAEKRREVGADGPGEVMEITRTIPIAQADHENGRRLYFRLPVTRGIPVVLHMGFDSNNVLWAHCAPLNLTRLPAKLPEGDYIVLQDSLEIDVKDVQAGHHLGLPKCNREIAIRIIDAMLSAGEDYWSNNFKKNDGSFRPLLIPHVSTPAKVRSLAKDSRKNAAQYLKKDLAICVAYWLALQSGSDDRQAILDELAIRGVTGVKTKRDLNKYLTRLGLPSLRAALRS